MKYKVIVFLMVIVLSFSVTPSTAKKIQKSDNWIYVDQFDNEYNETALDITQLTNNGFVIASSVVQTRRPFSFDMSLNVTNGNNGMGIQSMNMSILPILFRSSALYLTQEGAIPYIPTNITFGAVTIQNNSREILRSEWTFNNDPSQALFTTESKIYSIGLKMVLNTSNSDFSDYYEHIKEYVVSSNSDINDRIKVFTISPLTVSYEYIQYAKFSVTPIIDINKSFKYEIREGGLGLNSLEPAMRITYNDSITQPIEIIQTEPIRTRDGITLSQISQEVVYTLKQEPTTEETITDIITTTESPLAILPIFVTLVILSKKKKS